MKIASSEILMQSSYASMQKTETQERTRSWIGNKRPDFEAMEAKLQKLSETDASNIGNDILQENFSRLQADTVRLSDAALQAQSNEINASQAVDKIEDDLENDPRMMVIKYLIELMTGRKIEHLKTTNLESPSNADMAKAVSQANNAVANNQQTPPARPNAGWGVEIDVRHRYTETEQTKFQASGTITTADNKQIQFNLSFELNRSYQEESRTQIRQGDAKKIDPLTLNFSGNSAQLTSQKFEFDLNADGKKDSISFVQGAGFLAFDKNGDGKINDGSELFGPGTGNGFAELAAYDSDGNNWIDENDAIFDKLQVWTKDGAGKDQLQKLKQANVGALFLGNASTPFELNNANNQTQGQIRSSGIWLTEDGQVRSLQHVDLAV